MSKIEQMKHKALTLMADRGYPIKENVILEVDDKLPFMGYTTERNGTTLIVIAGWSLTSDMSMGLLIHELSHVYRIETHHPSHNASLQNKVLHNVFKGQRIVPYQQEILRNIINNIQDLYADDISFEVYIKQSQIANLNEFFLGWIRQPLKPSLTIQNQWRNAEFLLSAAFAVANLERHGVADIGNKVAEAVKEFLSQTDARQAKKFDFFCKMMTDLPENVSDNDFEQLLDIYTTEFYMLIHTRIH